MNINALKALYVALGGNLANTYADIADGIAVADYVLLADVISAIAKIAGSSIELPAVTMADEGKLLTVDAEGKWDKAEILPNDIGLENDYYNLSYNYATRKYIATSGIVIANFEASYDTDTSVITGITEAEKTPAQVEKAYFRNGTARNTIVLAKVLLADGGLIAGAVILPINMDENGFYFVYGTKKISGGYSDTEWTVSSAS